MSHKKFIIPSNDEWKPKKTITNSLNSSVISNSNSSKKYKIVNTFSINHNKEFEEILSFDDSKSKRKKTKKRKREEIKINHHKKHKNSKDRKKKQKLSSPSRISPENQPKYVFHSLYDVDRLSEEYLKSIEPKEENEEVNISPNLIIQPSPNIFNSQEENSEQLSPVLEYSPPINEPKFISKNFPQNNLNLKQVSTKLLKTNQKTPKFLQSDLKAFQNDNSNLNSLQKQFISPALRFLVPSSSISPINTQNHPRIVESNLSSFKK